MTFYEFLHTIYLGVLEVLYALLDGLKDAYFYLPPDWPAWAKVGIMGAAVLCLGYILFGIMDGGLAFLLRYPIKLIKRAWLMSKAPFGNAKFARLVDIKREGLHKKGKLFLGLWRGLFRKVDMFHHGEGHFLTIAAPGGGKTTAALIPTLLESKHGSFVITDPKGEITAMTKRHRESVSKVVYLNPYHEEYTQDLGVEYTDTGFNPFDMIEIDDNTRANADKFARLLCVTDRKDSNTYFKDEGAELLSLFITWVAKYEPPEHKNLAYLYSLTRTDPEHIFKYIDYAQDPTLVDDANRFRDMFENAPQQWAGAISKTQLATKRYVPTTPLARHVCKSGLKPQDLKKEDLTIYILLPSGHVETATPWLNMVIGLLGHAVGQAGKARPVTFLLDELPALGFLPDLRSQMRQYRTSGLRMWLFSQTAAALMDEDMYGQDGFKDILGICRTKQYFNIEELELAERISKSCGEQRKFNRNFQDRSEDFSFATTGVPLIRPEEVLSLPAGQQLILRGGQMSPIKSHLVPFFKRKRWRKMTDENPYKNE